MQKLYYFYTLSSSANPSNIRYVGVTTCKLSQRLSGHKYYALHKDKRSTPVHKWMFSEYTLGNTIIITQIDTCNVDKWEKTEQYWISEYRKQGYKLLNIQKGGAGVITKDMRNKDGLQRSIDAHKCPVYALDDNLNIVMEFNSAIEAVRYFGGKSRTAVTNAISHNVKTKKSFGYYWVKQSEYKTGNYYVNTTPNFEGRGIKVYRFNKKGVLIETYESCRDFARKCNIRNESAMKRAVKNKSIYLDSFWAFTENATFDLNSQFKYVEIDNNGNVIERFEKMQNVLDKYNCSISFLYRKNETCRGVLPNGNKIIKNYK